MRPRRPQPRPTGRALAFATSAALVSVVASASAGTLIEDRVRTVPAPASGDLTSVAEAEPIAVPRTIEGVDASLSLRVADPAALLPGDPDEQQSFDPLADLELDGPDAGGTAEGVGNGLPATGGLGLGLGLSPAATLQTIALGQVSPFRAPLPQLRLPEVRQAGGPKAFRVDFGRDTTFIDGGVGTPTAPGEVGASYLGTDGERFERFDLDLEWAPVGKGTPVQWLLISGVRATRADITRYDQASLGLREASATVAIPTIGTGVRWKPSDSLILSTTAATQTIEADGGVVDLSFNAEFLLSPKVGLSAGYEYYESTMSVQNLRTSLDREGLFAKITIRF